MISFQTISAEIFAEKILQGNLIYLSKAITFIESKNVEQKKKAEKILELCYSKSGNSMRIGITGIPGVGKSTFIESLGNIILQDNNKIAILAVDPSSKKNKGSILGDKTRMQTLATNPRVFIRPSPAGNKLGGVTSSTREEIILMEAAGFNIIIIETVGVGQSETDVFEMSDIFLLLLIAGAGDELQGLKKGIMEMADFICINKADSDNKDKSEVVKLELKRLIQLMQRNNTSIPTYVESCSSLTGYNVEKIWESINQFIASSKSSNMFYKKRMQQNQQWFEEALENEIHQYFLSYKKNSEIIEFYKIKMQQNQIIPSIAVKQIISNMVSPFI